LNGAAGRKGPVKSTGTQKKKQEVLWYDHGPALGNPRREKKAPEGGGDLKR